MSGVRGKRVLVTGGAGFIGSHLVDRLADDNHVVVVDNFTSGSQENLKSHLGKENIEIIEADIRDTDKMFHVTKGVDWIYHLAVQCLRLSIRNPELVHEVNATGTLNLCRAALRNQVERFVNVSSSEVYGTAKRVPMNEEHPLDPTTPYGASKLAGERYAKSFYYTFGLPVIIVRPFNTYGPRSHFEGAYGEVIPRFILRVLHGLPPVIFGDGLQSRDFTYVEDTARGILAASQADELVGEEVNIGSGMEITIQALAQFVLEITGCKELPIQYEDSRPGDVRRLVSDTKKIASSCNFHVSVSFQEGLRGYCNWVRTQVVDSTQLECGKNW